MNPEKLNELALFAGAGGGILGGKLLGWRTVCAVEWDAYARDVLVARQNDGCLEAFPIWDDIQTFDGRPWRGRVDVVSGGFPCQDISAAGKGAGIEGERSGMWKHMARIIGEILPDQVWVENSPMLVGRGLGTVLADLAEMGYDAEWGIVGAHHATAPHKRDRIWIMANANHDGTLASERSRNIRGGKQDAGRKEKQDGTIQPAGSNPQPTLQSNVAYAMRERSEAGLPEPEQRQEGITEKPHDGSGGRGEVRHAASDGLPHGVNGTLGQPGTEPESERSDWWATEPNVGRVAHGVAARVDRLQCIGNGQVPAVAALAWRLLGGPTAHNTTQ